jgi:branched-chain amino acid transport system substrate-binding protein
VNPPRPPRKEREYMKGTLRRAAAIALASVLVISLTACGSGGDDKASTTTGTEPYKVGAILSLTGTYAGLGAPEKNAIELEVKTINDAGGINGRLLEVIIEDDATDEAKAVAAAAKLIDQEGVIAILGATGTGQSMAIRGDIDRAGIAQISMAGGTAITANFDKLVYQTPWSNTIVVPFVLEKIKADGYTKIGLITDSGGYGKDGRDVILKDSKEMGIEVASDQTFNAGDADMSAQLTNIKGSGAEAILMWTAGKEAVTIAKNKEQLGITLPWYGGSGQARNEFAAGAGQAAEGFVFGTGKSLVPENWGKGTEAYAVVKGFSNSYAEAYGDTPDIFAGHAFDAMNILTHAIRRAGPDVDAETLNTMIEKTSGLVGFGGTYTFSSTDHNGLNSADLALYKVEGGAWVPLQ